MTEGLEWTGNLTGPKAPRQGTCGVTGTPARGRGATNRRYGGRGRSRAATWARSYRRSWYQARAGPRDLRRRRGRRLQPRLVAGCRHAGEAGLPPPGAPSGVPGRPSPAPTSVSSPPRDLGGVRARVCPHVRESLAADGRLPPIGGHGRSSRRGPDLAVRASARSPTSHARPRSAATRRPRACSSRAISLPRP